MIGFMSAALIVVILLVCVLGSVIFAFLAVLAGKGHPAAIWLVAAIAISGMLFITLSEVMS